MTTINKQMLEQKMDMILIQTPMRNQLVTNSSFENAHIKVAEDIKKMYQSNFYQQINIHYGVRSRMQQNLNQKIFKRRKQIIQFKIQLENTYINKLRRAESENDLDRIQKQYQQNMEKVKKRQNQFDPTQFIPYIYIQAKQKRPAYGKLFQQFDRKGVAMLKATIGYRAPFYLHDRIQFSMETPPIEYFRKRNYYEFGMNWISPTSYFGDSNFFAGTSASSGPLFRGVDQKKISTNFGFQKSDFKIEIEGIKRYPSLHERIDYYCSKGYHLPTSKLSAKFDRTLIDTLQKGQIMTGQLKEAKIQTTIPFVSQSQFVKAQYSFRRFYDIFSFSQNFKNKQLKLFFKNSSLETNFNLKAFAMKRNYVSDFIQNIQVRGFQNDRKPNQSVLQAKGSVKINNYNYPLFGGIGVVPFLYAQAGVSFQKDIKKPYALGSTGVGLSFPLGKHIQLQILYALFQAQNKPNREPVNFQIRIGLLD